MPIPLRKVWVRIHWLVGLTAGTVLAVMGTTGALLQFQDPILDWLNRDVRRVEARAAAPLPLPELLAEIQEQQPQQRILALQLSSDPEAAVRVTQQALPREGREGRPERRTRREVRYANPYSGVLIESPGARGEAFFHTTEDVHRRLAANLIGLPELGKQIVGASVVLALLLLLSGLYLRWPAGRVGGWRAWWTFDRSLRGQAFWWRVHAVVGSWAVAVLLMSALTGLQWSYDAYKRGLYALAGVALPQRRAEGADGAVRFTGDLEAAWQGFRTAIEPHGFASATFQLPQADGQPLEVRYLEPAAPHDRALSRLTLDAKTGRVLVHERYADLQPGAKLVTSIFALHSGSFFGLPGRLAFTAAASCMPVLFATGWLLYLGRLRRKRRERVRKEERELLVAVVPDGTAALSRVSGERRVSGESA